MQCNQCGFVLPTGASFCPNCAQPVSPIRATEVAPTENANQVAPTMIAPTMVAPTENANPVAPTVFAPLNANEIVPTPPPPPISYGQATPPPYAPTTPPPPINYGQAAPPPMGYPQAAPPPPMQAGAYGQPIMVPMMPQPQKKSGCTAGLIVAVVLLLVCVCGVTLFAGGLYIHGQQVNATATSIANDANDNATSTAYAVSLTPTPYPPYTESNSPSGATFSGRAQQVIANAQLADNVDSHNQPTSLESTFNNDQTIYLVYNWARGNTGYVQTRWYLNGELKDTSLSNYINQNANGYGYFSDSFFVSNGAVGQGAVEVFWCQDADCTHGGLAWVRPFSINP